MIFRQRALREGAVALRGAHGRRFFPHGFYSLRAAQGLYAGKRQRRRPVGRGGVCTAEGDVPALLHGGKPSPDLSIAGMSCSTLLIYQSPACSTDPLTILTAAQDARGLGLSWRKFG